MKKIEIDLNWLRQKIEIELLTQKEVAMLVGCSEDCLQKKCVSMKVKTQRTGPRSGSLHKSWKGGRVLVGRYWYIFSPEHPNKTKANYVAEHRLVMEKKLGRYLKRSEVVHHRDGNPQNNSIENLDVFSTNAEHLKYELKGRIPNWTEAGKASIRISSKKTANRLLLERGGFRRIQTNVHQTSKP